MFITLVITPAFVNFLAFHETNIISSKLKNLVPLTIWRNTLNVFFVHMPGGHFGTSVCEI